ncbi:universal stress protein [Spongisporangium articulatum]|uniref:Universal stress protein n=1 Tax=Spongisporangium articulatum TaxID=3362603 RepID=A0ABW8AKC7_9ACTN
MSSELSGPVVVGYHADASGHDALALGRLLAATLQVPLVVAKIYAAPAELGIGRVDAEWVSDRRAESQRTLDDARARLGSQSPEHGVEFRLVPAPSAARGLSELARELDASVIVVGSAETEGYAGGRVLAGSTASRLLSGAETPVAVAPRGYAGQPPAPVLRVAVAYQDTEEGRLAAEVAADLTRRARGELTLLTALAEENSTVPWLVGVDAQNAFAATARESFTAALEAAAQRLAPELGTTPATRLLVGDVVDRLAEAEADLMVVGSRGYGPVRLVLLGGLSSRLVRRATMPLLVTPRPE